MHPPRQNSCHRFLLLFPEVGGNSNYILNAYVHDGWAQNPPTTLIRMSHMTPSHYNELDGESIELTPEVIQQDVNKIAVLSYSIAMWVRRARLTYRSK